MGCITRKWPDILKTGRYKVKLCARPYNSQPALLCSLSCPPSVWGYKLQIGSHTLWGAFLWITGTGGPMAIFHSSPFMEMTESLTATPGCHVKMKQKQLAGEARDV